jgi:hypothetical protein
VTAQEPGPGERRHRQQRQLTIDGGHRHMPLDHLAQPGAVGPERPPHLGDDGSPKRRRVLRGRQGRGHLRGDPTLVHVPLGRGREPRLAQRRRGMNGKPEQRVAIGLAETPGTLVRGGDDAHHLFEPSKRDRHQGADPGGRGARGGIRGPLSRQDALDRVAGQALEAVVAGATASDVRRKPPRPGLAHQVLSQEQRHSDRGSFQHGGGGARQLDPGLRLLLRAGAEERQSGVGPEFEHGAGFGGWDRGRSAPEPRGDRREPGETGCVALAEVPQVAVIEDEHSGRPPARRDRGSHHVDGPVLLPQRPLAASRGCLRPGDEAGTVPGFSGNGAFEGDRLAGRRGIGTPR